MKALFVAILPFVVFCQPGAAQGLSWVKTYEGRIGQYPVTLHLHKKDTAYSGYYYYSSRQEPIFVSGNGVRNTAQIKLSAYIPVKEDSEVFNLSISGDSLSGVWKADEKSAGLPFYTKEIITAPAFDYIYTVGMVFLRPKIAGSPGSSFSAGAVWPKGNAAQDQFLKSIIRDALGVGNSSESIGRIFLNVKKETFTEYLEEFKDLKDEEVKEAHSLNYDNSMDALITYQSPKLLMLAAVYYTYTGGAHGNFGTRYTPVDLVNNKQLVIDDIVNAAGKKQLSVLLEKSFRKQYSVRDNDPLTEGGLFENKIEPNQNFYVTGKGIRFCYNPYEIGPYVMGEINIFIPFNSLNLYLQPGFKKLIQ